MAPYHHAMPTAGERGARENVAELTEEAAKAAADEAAARFKQSFVVLNRPGASATIGTAEVFRAKPDGYTMIFSSSGQMATYPWLYKKLSFDPVKSFTPIRAGASNKLGTTRFRSHNRR